MTREEILKLLADHFNAYCCLYLGLDCTVFLRNDVDRKVYDVLKAEKLIDEHGKIKLE